MHMAHVLNLNLSIRTHESSETGRKNKAVSKTDGISRE